MSQILSLPRGSYVRTYLNATHYRRRIIQFLIHLGRKYHGKIFPSIASIAYFAKCSERCVQKFLNWNADLGNIFFKVVPRIRWNNSTATNQYVMDDEFVKVMAWLMKRGLHEAIHKADCIAESIEKTQKFTPPTQESSPLYTDSSLKGFISVDFYKKYFTGVGLPDDAKAHLILNYSEHIIQESLHWYWAAVRRGTIRKTPKDYIIGTAKKLKEKFCS